MKTAAMAALAFAIMFSGPAAAQTVPTLVATVGAPNGVGAVVTLQWTALPGAEGYILQAGTSPGVADIATVRLPATFTQVTVFAPNGTYYVQAAGFLGPLVGEFSAVQSVNVGGPVTCGPLTAPAVAASTNSYLSVKVDWTPVLGASGYTVEYTRYNGITELAEPAAPTTNSVTKYAGIFGQFFVRVVAHNACGEQAASAYMPFSTSVGTGPRTPDPAPGTIIQRATLHYLRSVVEQTASQYRGDLLNSCGNNTFMYRVLRALRAIDSRWGLNYKRGWTGDLSDDIVSYNPTNRADSGESQVYLFDIISGHCGNSPGPNWDEVTDETWAARGSSECGSEWCAQWTIEPYLRAGFPPDGRQ
jgi:hypothetical protein